MKSPSKNSSQAEEKDSSQYPLELHPSWFEAPRRAPQPAYCDRLGCDCASQSRNFRKGLTAAVVEALFLEATWHRYAKQVIDIESDPPKGVAYLQLQVGIEEAACDIQMAQLTIKNYAKKAVAELKKKANAAKQRGNTNYSQCDETNAAVCADVEAYNLYQTVMLDLETLRLPRDLFIARVD